LNRKNHLFLFKHHSKDCQKVDILQNVYAFFGNLQNVRTNKLFYKTPKL